MVQRHVAYLHAQTQGVEHDQEEHEVLKVAGSDDVPHPVLVRVLRDVAPEGAGLEGVLDTLALETRNRHGLTVCYRTQHYTHAFRYTYSRCIRLHFVQNDTQIMHIVSIIEQIIVYCKKICDFFKIISVKGLLCQ